MLKNKLLMFGLLGAAGCLAGWLVGEGLLLACLPKVSGPAEASLIVRPDPPDLAPPEDRPAAVAPKLPPSGAGKAKSVPPPPPEFRKRLERWKGQQTGDVRVTLIWNNYNDLDLHCVDPDGEEICFRNKKSASGGELDVDKNVSPTTDEPVENIYWPEGGAGSGTYRVYVNHYNHHSGRSRSRTPFQVNLLVDGRQQDFDGVISEGDAKRLIHTFTLGANFRLAVSPEVEVEQGGSNRIKAKVERERFRGAVTVSGAATQPGVSIGQVTIGEGETDGELEVSAARDAEGGLCDVRVTATGGDATAEASLQVIVRELSPELRIAVPERVEVNQGGSNGIPFKIARDHFEGPVEAVIEGEMDELDIPRIVLQPDDDEGEFDIQSASDAAPGDRLLRVVFRGGGTAAESPLNLLIHRVGPPVSAWSWLMVLLIGVWTSLLAIGLSLALVGGQNRYLHRPLFSREQLAVVAGGGAVVGLVAGGLAQSLLSLLAAANFFPSVGFVIGWALLGGMLGCGMSYFVPNLPRSNASAAGAVGGLAGAIAFLAMSSLLGDVAGRLIGAAALGSLIGLMVAFAEMAFRSAWLEVYRGKEMTTVTLGPEAVLIGSARGAAVRIADAPERAYRIRTQGRTIILENLQDKTRQEVSANYTQTVGPVRMIVKTSAAPAAAPKKPPPPPPPAPMRRASSHPPGPPATTGSASAAQATPSAPAGKSEKKPIPLPPPPPKKKL